MTQSEELRIALIADIHANYVALEAVLEDIEAREINFIVCLGDVAATGPQPDQCVARLRELNCPVVMGNTDEWMIRPPRPRRPVLDEITYQLETIDKWCLKQLSDADLDFMASFKRLVAVPLGAGRRMLCFHGSPRNNTDVISATTPEQDLERLVSGYSAVIMAGGHSHQQMLRQHRDTVIINPGSVGLPYEFDRRTQRVYNPAWAEYAIVSGVGNTLGVAFQRVPIDVEALRQAMLKRNMPFAEQWVMDWR